MCLLTMTGKRDKAMGLFTSANIIPDDIADKFAQRIFEHFNCSLENSIDENIKRYNPYEDLKMKPFWHYGSIDEHFTLKYEKEITPEMEFCDWWTKGNSYISCDRFSKIHVLNEETISKVMELVRKKFETQRKTFVYRVFYDKYYKSLCFVPSAYITLEQKLTERGDGKGKTSYCRFPMPDHYFFKLEPPRYKTVQDRPDLKVDAELTGITLLSENEARSCMHLITFQQKPVSWWLRDLNIGGLLTTKVMQPNELVYSNGGPKNRAGISPAVTGDLKDLKRGDKVLFAGHKWTVIFENMIFVDDLIGYGPFNYYSEFYSADENLYENSRVKDFIEHWFEQHKDDPVYRASR